MNLCLIYKVQCHLIQRQLKVDSQAQVIYVIEMFFICRWLSILPHFPSVSLDRFSSLGLLQRPLVLFLTYTFITSSLSWSDSILYVSGINGIIIIILILITSVDKKKSKPITTNHYYYHYL